MKGVRCSFVSYDGICEWHDFKSYDDLVYFLRNRCFTDKAFSRIVDFYCVTVYVTDKLYVVHRIDRRIDFSVFVDTLISILPLRNRDCMLWGDAYV